MKQRKILYIQYTNPAGYPSLEHSSRILGGKGWKILFLGTGAFGTNALSFPLHKNIKDYRLPFCHGGWFQKMHYFWFCLWVISWVIRWRPHWIYASDPLSCSIGFLLSYIPGLKVIYHEHDSPGPMMSRGYCMRLVLWARKGLSGRVALAVLPNEQRTYNFRKETNTSKKILTVWNCPLEEEAMQKRRPKESSAPTIYYHGSINPNRFPLTLVRALALLEGRAELWIVGYETVGTCGWSDKIKHEAEKFGVERRIKFLPPVSYHELYRITRECDIGVAIIPKTSADTNLKFLIGASNKVFDYLACGLALLVSDLPDWRKMYVEPGYGLACNPDDPESIAASLRWFLEHPKEMRDMGERGRQRILTEWNYERQFEPVVNFIEKLQK